jgi:hypothetical protein
VARDVTLGTLPRLRFTLMGRWTGASRDERGGGTFMWISSIHAGHEMEVFVFPPPANPCRGDNASEISADAMLKTLVHPEMLLKTRERRFR